MAFLADNASQTYLSGAKSINLRRDRIPPLDDISNLVLLVGEVLRGVGVAAAGQSPEQAAWIKEIEEPHQSPHPRLSSNNGVAGSDSLLRRCELSGR